MNKTTKRRCWRRDLAEYRGLSDRDRAAFLIFLEWFENFRLRMDLEAGREAAVSFWRTEVMGRQERETWQLDQWSAAIAWYLQWLKACAMENVDHRSLPERIRGAVVAACSRRGLARRTKQCYGAWAARYGKFAGRAKEARRVECATRFLTSLVQDEECAYSTQKQALNALAFLFKHVLGIDEPKFAVKLRKTGPRIPTVLSTSETQRLFEKLEGRYELAASLQYGAGLRLSELVRLRIKDLDLERGTVTVRQGKGDKDRVTVLPRSLVKELQEQVEKARVVWKGDREKERAGVFIPGALGRKFAKAAESFEWF